MGSPDADARLQEAENVLAETDGAAAQDVRDLRAKIKPKSFDRKIISKIKKWLFD
jgi:hypothetical protein